jgi:hypothetical protein
VKKVTELQAWETMDVAVASIERFKQGGLPNPGQVPVRISTMVENSTVFAHSQTEARRVCQQKRGQTDRCKRTSDDGWPCNT